jgi:hypothetical protein
MLHEERTDRLVWEHKVSVLENPKKPRSDGAERAIVRNLAYSMILTDSCRNIQIGILLVHANYFRERSPYNGIRESCLLVWVSER